MIIKMMYFGMYFDKDDVLYDVLCQRWWTKMMYFTKLQNFWCKDDAQRWCTLPKDDHLFQLHLQKTQQKITLNIKERNSLLVLHFLLYLIIITKVNNLNWIHFSFVNSFQFHLMINFHIYYHSMLDKLINSTYTKYSINSLIIFSPIIL